MELIDRLGVIKALDKAKIKTTSEEYDRIIDVIGSMATIEERKTGRWEHIGGDEWVCSECGYVISTEGSWEHPKDTGKDFCEHCGAEMERII